MDGKWPERESLTFNFECGGRPQASQSHPPNVARGGVALLTLAACDPLNGWKMA